jgi:hypothetical protein
MLTTSTTTVRRPLAPRAAALVALASSAILLAPVPGAAQSAPTRVEPVRVVASAPTRSARDNARADTLEQWATKYYNVPREWRTAARLHERAAMLRGDDPRAAESFRMSAWLYRAARDAAYARVMMEKSAQHAASGGDVERAANAYVDAAVLAIEANRDDQVPGLLRKTRVVLGSPLLTSERRETILRRIGGETRLALAWVEQ